jgi:hypothetical protein
VEEVEREMAYDRINDIFDELGDETLARLFLPNGLGGERVDLLDLARSLADVGVTDELIESAIGHCKDEGEIRKRCDEFSQRTIEPRKQRILYYARARTANRRS